MTKLEVRVVGDEIIVRYPGVGYSVTYYKSDPFPDLRAKNIISGKHDRRAPREMSQFLAKAWKLANDKARELGWIVEGGRSP
jgi:hypothetical protein